MNSRSGAGRRRVVLDRGASSVEYGALIVLVTLLIVGLVSASFPGELGAQTRQAVCRLFNASCAGAAAGTGGAGQAAPGQGAPGQGAPGQGAPGQGAPGQGGPGVGEQVGSFFVNLGGALVDDLKGIVELVKDPSLILDGLKAIVDDPLGVLRQLIVDDESLDLFERGDYGGGIGRVVYNVGSLVFSPAAILKAAKLGKFGKLGTAGKVAREAADKAAREAREKAAREAAERQRRPIPCVGPAKARTLGPSLSPPGHKLVGAFSRSGHTLIHDLTVAEVRTFSALAGSASLLAPNCDTEVSSNGSQAANAAALKANGAAGFSGVYDPATGRFVMRVSDGPNAVVDRYGGHATINDEVFSGSKGTVGFAAVLGPDNVVRLKWNSGINTTNHGTRAAPAQHRKAVADAIRRATGLTVEE